ncbi:MAG: helix-turn-helix domain-containing protein [Eubacterium ventriosum]
MYYSDIKESGSRIKYLRKQKGYTQRSFADEIGISPRTYSGIESGAHSTSIEAFVRNGTDFGNIIRLHNCGKRK